MPALAPSEPSGSQATAAIGEQRLASTVPCQWEGSPPPSGHFKTRFHQESCNSLPLRDQGFLRATEEFPCTGISPMLCIGEMERFQPSATGVSNRHKRRSATDPEPGAQYPAKTLSECLIWHISAWRDRASPVGLKSCSHKGSSVKGAKPTKLPTKCHRIGRTSAKWR